MTSLPLPKELSEKILSCAETPVYLVGGALRDFLLEKKTQDLDLVCEGSPVYFSQNLAKSFNGTLVVLDDQTKIYRIVLPKGLPGPVSYLDVAKMQGRTIEEDLGRRDFTVDSMALPLSAMRNTHPHKLIDPFDGQKDLRRKTLKMVHPQVFQEDPLRMLRAFRLAAQLGFKIEAKTSRQIKKDAARLLQSSYERIQQELAMIFRTKNSCGALEAMDKAGLLTEIFPELEASRGCAVVYYGKGGVLKHSFRVLKRLEYLLENLPRLYPDLHQEIGKDLDPVLLKLTALLHDVAKPATARMRKGRLRFFGHEEKGGQMASKILRRLRFSKNYERACELMIRDHLRPGNLAANPVISDRAMYRFFKDLQDQGVNLLLTAWADHSSYLTEGQVKKIEKHLDQEDLSIPPGVPQAVHKTLKHLLAVSLLLRHYFRRPEKVFPPKLIDGNDVMKALKMKPGPEVGKILEKLREAQATGKIHTREEALSFIRKL